MKVLVLGNGSMGMRRATQAVSLGHDVRTCDPAADKHAHFRDESSAWSWRPDAVAICSPARLHLQQMADAMWDEIPFFVEKPLALDSQLDAAKGLVAEAERYGHFAAVGYNLRQHEGVRFLKLNLDMRRRFGLPPRAALFTMLCDKSLWPGQYEDMLLEASHEIDLALHLLGPARVAYGKGAGDKWNFQLDHDCGVTSLVSLDGAMRHYRREAKLYYPDGESLRWRWQAGPGENQAWDVEGKGTIYGSGVQSPDDTHASDFRAFLDGLNEGTCPPCGLSDGLAVLEICAEVRRFARPR